jgi:hypothetical protein
MILSNCKYINAGWGFGRDRAGNRARPRFERRLVGRFWRKSRSVRQEKEGDRLEQCNLPVTLNC